MTARSRQAAIDISAERMAAMLGTGIDVATRTIFFIGEICDEKIEPVVKALHLFDQHPGDINIFLSSGGGDVSAGMVLFDAIKRSKSYVTIAGYGDVQSMGALVLQAGDFRYLARHANFMIHDGVAHKCDPAPSGPLLAFAREVHRQEIQYWEVLSERSGLSISKIQRMCARDTFMDAPTALRMGFIDAILPVPSKGKS